MRPYLTPLSTFTLFVSSSSNCTSTLWYMYNLLMNFLSHQLIPVSFRICIYLVQFTQSNTFSQSMQQTSNSSSKSKVHSGIFHSIPTVTLVPFSLLHHMHRRWNWTVQLLSHRTQCARRLLCNNDKIHATQYGTHTLEAIHSWYAFLQCANVINCNKENIWIPMQVSIHYIFKSVIVFSAIYYLSYI